VPTGAAIATIRQQVDVEAFGSPRRHGTPSAGH